MTRLLPVLAAASLVASAAFAQNVGNGGTGGLTTGIAPGSSSGAVTPGMGPSGTGAVTGNTAAGGGMAPSTTPMGAAPRAAAPASPNRAEVPPMPGANSFTRGQARARMQRSGYAQVTDLRKDGRGIWRAKAVKDGQHVNVALDYQGNVTAQ